MQTLFLLVHDCSSFYQTIGPRDPEASVANGLPNPRRRPRDQVGSRAQSGRGNGFPGVRGCLFGREWNMGQFNFLGLRGNVTNKKAKLFFPRQK